MASWAMALLMPLLPPTIMSLNPLKAPYQRIMHSTHSSVAVQDMHSPRSFPSLHVLVRAGIAATWVLCMRMLRVARSCTPHIWAGGTVAGWLFQRALSCWIRSSCLCLVHWMGRWRAGRRGLGPTSFCLADGTQHTEGDIARAPRHVKVVHTREGPERVHQPARDMHGCVDVHGECLCMRVFVLCECCVANA